MITIYLVRHGQTDDNTVDILTGRNDVELNSTGIKQAEHLRNVLAGIAFDDVFCSPLKRAIRTAEIITGKPQTELIIKQSLIERSVGALEGFRFKDMDRQKYWNYYDCEGIYGAAESCRSIEHRVKVFLEEVKEQYAGKDSTILVVTHHGISRLFRKCFEPIPANGDLLYFGLHNGEYKIYKLEN